MVNNYYYLRGGAERVLFDDQAGLEASGHQVLPFTARSDANRQAPWQELFPQSYDHGSVRGWNRARAAIATVYSAEAGRAFAAFLNSAKPEVIHCHNIYGRLTTAVLDAARRRGIPVVLTVHDYKIVCPSYLMLRRGMVCDCCTGGGYWRCLINRCHKTSFSGSLVYSLETYFNRLLGKYDWVSRFLCPSRFLLDMLDRGGYPTCKLTLHPNSVREEQYQPNSTPGKYVLYAGRLSQEKGLSTLLTAFEASCIPLKIAGDGPLRQELQRRIEAAPSANIALLGYQTADVLHRLIREAAFVVLPSEWYENAPMAVLEAFALGKPVLAARIGGIPELVEDGRNGALFPSGDAPALAEAAKRLWADRPRLEQMGRSAREIVVTRYSHRERTARLLELYREVCA